MGHFGKDGPLAEANPEGASGWRLCAACRGVHAVCAHVLHRLSSRLNDEARKHVRAALCKISTVYPNALPWHGGAAGRLLKEGRAARRQVWG